MTWRLIIIFLVCSGLLAGCNDYKIAKLNHNNMTGAYRLGPSDQLRIMVFGQKEMSNRYQVDSTGRISIPLVGAVRVHGRTTRQVERIIISRLQNANIVNDPQVSIEVTNYRPFFIQGEVKSSGSYPFQVGLTFEKAIATSGGYTIHADKKHFVVSRMVGNKLEKYKVTPDHLVHPGDSITVQERWF